MLLRSEEIPEGTCGDNANCFFKYFSITVVNRWIYSRATDVKQKPYSVDTSDKSEFRIVSPNLWSSVEK